jgi:hypothetical protein
MMGETEPILGFDEDPDRRTGNPLFTEMDPVNHSTLTGRSLQGKAITVFSRK